MGLKSLASIRLKKSKSIWRPERMQMHVIVTELGPDWAGPYTDITLLQKTLAIIQKIDPDAEIVSRESDPYKQQIEAGLLPYHIRVSIVGGEPQLPADVRLTWPPAEVEGIQEGTADHTVYFAWGKNEKDALVRLARLNRTIPEAKAEA
jgi:hypothetical protein